MSQYCTSLSPIIGILKAVLTIVQWAIPIILIFLGTFDLMKAVIASKEDEIKSAQKLLIKRVVYAIVIFLVPAIVQIVFTIVSKNVTEGTQNFWECWGQVNQQNNG